MDLGVVRICLDAADIVDFEEVNASGRFDRKPLDRWCGSLTKAP